MRHWITSFQLVDDDSEGRCAQPICEVPEGHSFGDLSADQFHYRLGLLYEEKQELQTASEAYRRFLHYWKDADADLPVLADAKQRLAALEAQASA